MADTQGAQKRASKRDIQLSELGPLSWKSPDEIEQSLTALYQFADGAGKDAYDWYMREKHTKQRWSRGLRLAAIILAIVGGLMPIVVAIVGGAGGWAWLGQLGYLALGLAAGCVLIDKFFGSSSGWTRYIVAAQELQTASSRYRFAWNTAWLRLAGQELTRETAEPFVDLARDYVAAVDLCVQQETQRWIAEFQAGLALVDHLTKGQGQGILAASQPEAASTIAPGEKGPTTGGNGTDKKGAPGVPSPTTG